MTPAPSPVLAIDSASDDIALAVVLGDAVLAERRWRADGTVAEVLLGGIDALLGDAGIARDALGALAVNVGPGGYGGLRAGVATAQGIATALDLPLAGVSRLEADALPLLEAHPGRVVIAVHAAGRAGVAWAAYTLPADAAGGSAPPSAVVAPRIDPPERAADEAPPGALWCGEIEDALRAALAGRDAEIAMGDTGRRPGDLVRLARRHDAFGDPALVDVTYLRPPPITQPKH